MVAPPSPKRYHIWYFYLMLFNQHCQGPKNNFFTFFAFYPSIAGQEWPKLLAIRFPLQTNNDPFSVETEALSCGLAVLSSVPKCHAFP